MLVDASNGHITQRTHPQLSQVGITLTDSKIIASHQGLSDLEIPLVLDAGNSIEVTVWNDTVEAIAGPDAFGEWFAKILNEAM